ncbi:MAG: cytochrome c biogenesis protein CcsA [Thermoguttaceae bacterium]|jgi:ABC-type transport system involved in cytochrome c biogenesis permease subunit
MTFMSGISIICFAGSYTVALALELSRLLFRSAVRGFVLLGFAGAGLVAHSAFLYYRALRTNGTPLSSSQDWFLLAAWVLVVVYLYLLCYYPKTNFGLFLLPLVLGLIGTAKYCADARPFGQMPASKVWGLIHGTSILLATVTVLVGFAAGMMYLHQSARLKRKHAPGRGVRLPSLEWLARLNSRAIVLSVLMLGVGVLSGVVLNLIQARRRGAPLPWNDPVILATLVMFAWLLAATLINAFSRPARRGHKVAYLTVASFVFLAIALAVGLFLNTQHGVPRNQGAMPAGKKGTGTVAATFLILPNQVVPRSQSPFFADPTGFPRQRTEN